MSNRAPTDVRLVRMARSVALMTLDISFRADTGHVGSSLSISDILTVLYAGSMRNVGSRPDRADRDRFILSKGHAAAALYAVLYTRGILKKKELDSFGSDTKGLCEHPVIQDAGVEMTSGSLGHGLAFSTGIALGLKKSFGKKRRVPHVYVLISDGECAEGSVWEAAMLASRLRLDNLTCVVDYNGWQCFGKTEEVSNLEPFIEKWQSFGWNVVQVDGHDVVALRKVFHTPISEHMPRVVIARTTSGKGVSIIENKQAGHYHVFSKEEYVRARKELLQR